ncbi:DUF397 domain-containing protein [Amycolatopsis cihanbeyliensis]|uniref:Uncharacterized protein DUF397 n=1 Tax=Amycolatopsis cihanbeyliensis TaxID=1128664 RepID=A0A542DLY3_AMYCI|nr:DUF397 domain-containing protein [Amycolatopsis cihanbeyliensis]TQJ04097.1 uncharacterized protein DUF397 [Amycolatopsis cihanbeyliensis]
MTTQTWRTSSYTAPDNNCVEVARDTEHAAVRDTKNRHAGYLTFDSRAFTTFLAEVRAGRTGHSR